MTHLFVLLVLIFLQGILQKGFPEAFSLMEVQLTLNFGFLLLAAYLFGEWTARIRLPKLTGYLLAGILLGPDVLGYFSRDSVASLRFMDELALTFIALSAGLELRMKDLQKQWRVLAGLIAGIPVAVFCLVFPFLYFALPQLGLPPALSSSQRVVFASLMATAAVALSPAATLAVIKECRARGEFSESVLCVTVVTDILVIMLFSILLAVADPKVSVRAAGLWIRVPAEIALSLLIGFFLAWFMSAYVKYIRREGIFFFLCVAFLVTRLSHAVLESSESVIGIFLHLEPLLICMSAGFFLRNRFRKGAFYEETIDRSFLPIFVVFFALAGAALNLEALGAMWTFELFYVGLRIVGIFLASHLVLGVLRAPFKTGSHYGMGFITQAGVSIGLAGLIPGRFPEGGDVLYTILVAAVVINQIVGPIAFKFALEQSSSSTRQVQGLGL